MLLNFTITLHALWVRKVEETSRVELIDKIMKELSREYKIGFQLKSRIRKILSIIWASAKGTRFEHLIDEKCLKSVAETYLNIYANYGKLVNTSYPGLLPALLYLAHECDLSYIDILRLNWPFPVDRRFFWRIVKRFIDVEGVKPKARKKTVEEIIEDTAKKLGIDDRRVIEYAGKVYKYGYKPGMSRLGIAGAAIYIACLKHGCHIPQEEIAKAVGTTSVTIRKRIKDIRASLGEEV